MFTIKKIADERLSQRICDNLGVEDKGAFAYGAFQDDKVLATAAFVTEPGGCVALRRVDTGRRQDIGLIDGMARAAFSAQLRAGAKTARLGDELDLSLRQALSKLGYAPEGPFALEAFFAQKNCGRK